MTAAIDYRKLLENQPVSASAPCRVDLGGTLDISTFFLPLRRFDPCTVNIAIDLRTTVRLFPFRRGRVRVASAGFEPAEFAPEEAPFNHPLGLIFAVASCFGLSGVEIRIESASPVRSALGGSSVAVVALVGALLEMVRAQGEPAASPEKVALLAQRLESSVARVPCGVQDQLAAVFGGVNCWHWTGADWGGGFRRKPIVDPSEFAALGKRLLVAYCGVPHESRDINGRWVARFLEGRDRKRWAQVIAIVHRFSDLLARKDFAGAAHLMNRETELRLEMTPDVLDPMGSRLVKAATAEGCGGRFTGAGGGGCIWSIGEEEGIDRLRRRWRDLLATRDGARLLDVGVDSRGLLCQL